MNPMKKGKVLSKVSSEGRITLPKEIREKLNLQEGDHVTFMEVDGRIVVQKAEMDEFPSDPDLHRAYHRTKERYSEALRNLKDR